ncbi:chemotaxis protein CheB [Brachyspira pilosicoli]|uniref:protein-glutamate methylesterase n=1 Tax=Brachyspira pilosicoli TaxID=52584 RepID=A0A5C8EYW6_BRAPL|nr:chemotaxis protein CheB [Brachyspira pilosicoli]TXJ42121.1 response regulator [Brachyspira pilosicoli]
MGLFINVLIAEDSKEISDNIKKILLKNPAVKIVNIVNNGIDAYKTIINKKTDFAFIEFNLPLMTASEILRQLKKDNINTKIIILSTTDKNDDFNSRLTNLGAFKIINKSAKKEYIENEISNIIVNKNIKKEEFIKKEEIKINENIKNNLFRNAVIPKNTINTFPYNINRVSDVIKKINYSDFKNPKLIAIGISTGGPKALRSLIPSIPKNFPIPILIAQHIPKDFSYSLAKGLNDVSQITVKEAEDNEEIKSGFAYICPGENNMGIHLDNNNIKIKLREDLKTDLPYMPSVNHLFNTINDNLKDQAIAVIMTGMGNDGTEGMINLYNNKNLTIAQNKTTSTIFGMPKSAIENNAVHFIVSLYDIADFLVQYTTIKLKGKY